MIRAGSRALAALLFAALMAGGTAPASPARAQAAPRETLTIGITQFPSTFHPAIESMAAKSYILAMARRPITTYGPDWALTCMMCVRLPTIENGDAVPEIAPNGRPGVRVTYRLPPEARWGDGTPITARDILFAWEAGRHPQSGFGPSELYRTIHRITVEDPRSFTVHADKLTFQYNALNDLPILPEHLERAAFEQDPRGYRNRTRYDTETAHPGLWFGPYRIASVATGSHVVLERNPHWWGARPHFNRIIVRAIENTAALEANLLSGGIDMIAGELGLSLDQGIAFEKRHGARFRVAFKPGLVYEHIDLNLDNPALQDRRVRQALLLALDRAQIVARLFENRQPVAGSFVNPLDWVHDPATPAWAHDAARARALLEEAGWRPGPDGIRRNEAGARLSFELMSTAGNRSRELVQQVLQAQWRAVGVEVRIRNEPPRVFFSETVSRRRFQGMALFAWLSSPENVPRTTLHSTQIPTAGNNWSGQNYTGFRSAEMDALIEAVEIELDRDKRRALWSRIQAIYATELPVLPLFFRADTFVTPRWLQGLVPTGHQFASTLWVEQWRVGN
ncbi:MAG: peptide ABC transporter substrate-binding protein [Alphaproteobacteria bacterium]|nr:peptide ABC transporter substrate-binding protein [Alphaproteobacteria bacterium]